MRERFPDGMWPVMLTPFTKEGAVDYPALERLVKWYEAGGADGLFAVCQSSEMFFLSAEERAEVARFVAEKASIPVIASGHVSDGFEEQAAELNAMALAGAEALVLITNRLAGENESDEVLLQNLDALVQRLPEGIPLGVYECPYPYKRLLTKPVVEYMVQSGRFYFIKDTCCDIDTIRQRLTWIAGSNIKLFNANTATLLQCLRLGAAGYSGVMANFHPGLYRWLLDNWQAEPQAAERLSALLTMCSLIEAHSYPQNAKYMMQLLDNGFTLHTRNPAASAPMAAACYEEVRQLKILSDWAETDWLSADAKGGAAG